MLILLSGPIGSGKTTLCARAAAAARARGIAVAGVLAPAIVQRGAKVGIEAVDLVTGERRLLARADRDLLRPRTGRKFDRRGKQRRRAPAERLRGRSQSKPRQQPHAVFVPQRPIHSRSLAAARAERGVPWPAHDGPLPDLFHPAGHAAAAGLSIEEGMIAPFNHLKSYTLTSAHPEMRNFVQRQVEDPAL